jgi:hypothetical protein
MGNCRPPAASSRRPGPRQPFRHRLTGIEAPPEVMIAVANAIPYPSIALAPAAASITSRIAAAFNPGTARRAAWLTTSSTHQAALGRREEALAAIKEAAGIYRDLAAARPDAFRPDLAMNVGDTGHLPHGPGFPHTPILTPSAPGPYAPLNSLAGSQAKAEQQTARPKPRHRPEISKRCMLPGELAGGAICCQVNLQTSAR